MIAALSIANTSYPPKNKPVYTLLTIRHEFCENFFVEGLVGTRSQPSSLTVWNPVRAQWGVEGGISLLGAEVSIGHLSDHGIDKVDPRAESYNYLKLRVRKEFK